MSFFIAGRIASVQLPRILAACVEQLTDLEFDARFGTVREFEADYTLLIHE